MRQQPAVLVVDDDAMLVQVLKRGLEAAGIQVWTAGDAVEALCSIVTRPVDLILVDYQMPDVNGEAFLIALRGDVRYGHLPVIMITGQGHEVDVQRLSRQYDLKALCLKPIAMNQIVQAVMASLEPGGVPCHG